MKISVIGLGMYSLAISKMLAKKENNKIMIWTENNAKYEEYKKTKKVASVYDTEMPKNIKVSNLLFNFSNNFIYFSFITFSSASRFFSCNASYASMSPIILSSVGFDKIYPDI